MLVARSNEPTFNRHPTRALLRVIFVLVTLMPSLVAAQDPEVNFEGLVNGVRANLADGEVFLDRNNSKDKLTPGRVLEDGDRIISERSSRAEVLLQPGNYLRLSSETQLKFLSTDYDKLRIELSAGTINFELINDPWNTAITEAISRYDLTRVITPAGEVLVVQPGIIRINVKTDGALEVTVRSGLAIIDGQFIKSKKAGVKKNGVLTIAEKDPKEEDEFDSWCRSRAEQLVKANRALKKDPLWIKTHENDKEPVVDFGDSEEKTEGSPYVVSAKPGAILFVDVGAEVLNSKGDWQPVDDKTDLNPHDRLRTAPFSHIELSIFPDIYLRLDGNSELLLEALSNDGVTLKLIRGAMIVDAAIFKQKNLPEIRIGGVSTTGTIADQGSYRVDVRSKTEQLTVREGKLLISGRSLGACRAMTDGVISDCGKKRNDNFDYWSQSRGEGQAFSGRAMATSVTRRRKVELRERGFWYLPTGSQQFTFVAFYVKTFESPYGGEYSVALTTKEMPMRVPMHRPNMRGFPGRIP